MIRAWDNSKEYLAELKKRRKELIDNYGNEGQKHHLSSLIGGLNPAARELHIVRSEIARIEKNNKKNKPAVKLHPLYDGYTETSKRLPMGLLFDMHISNGKTIKAQLGKDNFGKFYIVIRTDEGTKIIDNFCTIGDAKKALLKEAAAQ